MEYSIKSTQHAYSLEDVNKIQFPANNDLTIKEIKNNQEVIDNVRINDQEPLIQVYNQLQGIRPYYVFHDVDVDRYVIDGIYKQVFLSARELDQTRLNEQARTWVNPVSYTHLDVYKRQAIYCQINFIEHPLSRKLLNMQIALKKKFWKHLKQEKCLIHNPLMKNLI